MLKSNSEPEEAPAPGDITNPGSESEKVKIVIWSTEGYREILDFIIERYYGWFDPDLEITVEYFQNSEDILNNILADSELSRLPNAVFADDIGKFVRTIPDLSMSLDEYIDKDIFTSQAAVSNCSIEGVLRAFPVASYLAAFYYNREILELCGLEMPENPNIEQFLDLANRLKEETGKYIIAYYDDLSRIFMLSTGKLFYDGSGNLVTDNVQEWFEFLENLRESGVIYCDANNIDEYMSLVANGTVCGVIGGFYWCQNIVNMLADNGLEQDWAVTIIPQSYPFEYNVSLADTGCMIIAKESEKTQAIIDFLKSAFVSDPDVMRMLAWMHGLISVTPIPEDCYENLYIENFPQNVFEFLASLLGNVSEIEYGEYTQPLLNKFEELSKGIITGQTTVEEAYGTFTECIEHPDDLPTGGGSGRPPVKLVGIEITQPPNKVEYLQYERFSPAGMKVTVTYDDGTTKDIIGYDWEPVSFEYWGEQDVTIIYKQGGKEFTAIQRVNVLKRELVGISAKPALAYYYEGYQLKTDDLIVYANYKDGYYRRVENFSINNPLPDSVGKYTVGITCYIDGKQYTCTTKINVYKKLLSIDIKSPPNQLMYNNGDRFNSTGMTVYAYYRDTEEIRIEKEIFIGYLSITPNIIKFKDGETSAKITITYSENGISEKKTQLVYKKTGAEADDCDITQDFGGCGTGAVNLSSGKLKYRFTDFACSDSTFPITISRIYDVDAGNNGVGKGWRLNLQQELIKEGVRWKYIDKNGKAHIFDNGFSTDGGRSAIRNETLGFDLFNDGDIIRLVDRNNNTLVFKIIKGVYRLTSVHQYPSTPYGQIKAYSMDIAYSTSTGYISNVTAGRVIDGKRRSVQFDYTNDLLKSLTYKFAGNTVVAEYEYSGNDLISIKKRNGNVIAPYSATTKFQKTDSGFIVEDLSSKDEDGNCKSLIYTVSDGKVSAISVGYDDTQRETTTVSYTDNTTALAKEDNPETNIVASGYTEYNGTLSVTSFDSQCAASSYSYEKDEDGTYLKPKKVYGAVSHGFDYKALADSYSDTLDVFHDDFESGNCGWSGGYSTTDRHICGTASLKSSHILSKSYTFNTDKADGQTLYLSLWAISNGKITLTVKVDGSRGSGEFTHNLDSGLKNMWQFTAFCLGRVYNGETITVKVEGSDVCIADVRLTKAPYETPEDLALPEYNAFGNIEKEYQYSPVDDKIACTEYKYNEAHQLTEKIITVNGNPHSNAVYSYQNGLLVGTKVYGTGNNYFEEKYRYTDYVQTKTININDVTTEYSEGMDWAQSTTYSSDNNNCPDVTVKNTYYTNSDVIMQVSSSQYLNELYYTSEGALELARYGNSLAGIPSEIFFEYDTFGNMSAVKIGTSALVELEYDYKHLKEILYANGDAVKYSYDNKNRITEIAENRIVDNVESCLYSATITYGDNAEDTVTVSDTNGLTYQSRAINTGGKTSEYCVKFAESYRPIIKVVGLALNGAGNISTTEIYTDNSETPFERTVTVADRNGKIKELKR